MARTISDRPGLPGGIAETAQHRSKGHSCFTITHSVIFGQLLGEEKRATRVRSLGMKTSGSTAMKNTYPSEQNIRWLLAPNEHIQHARKHTLSGELLS